MTAQGSWPMSSRDLPLDSATCCAPASALDYPATVRRILLTCVLVLLAACVDDGETPGSGRPDLKPHAALDLSGAEASARDQMVAQREAVEGLLEQPDADPADLAEAFADLGLLYVTYEFLESAGVCFENARRLAPEDYRWHYLAGYLAMIQGRLEQAIADYRRALELEPAFLPAVLRMGRSELDRGRYPAARSLFERALELDPAAAAGHEGMGHVAGALGDHGAAIGHFERSLELDPAATGLHYALGQAYRNLGDLDAARGHLEQAGDVAARVVDPLINPLANLAESAQFYLVQGAEAVDDGDYAAAAAAFRGALERDPESLDATRGLVTSLERLGDHEGAVRELERALESASGVAADSQRRVWALNALGGLAASAEREDEALERFRQSLATDPEQPEILLRLANGLARQRRFEDAVRHYDRVLELEPGWVRAVLEKRATALVNLGRRRQAVADFERAVAAAPGDPALRRRFAEALEFLGEEEAAAEQRAALSRLATDGRQRLSMVLESARRLVREGDPGAALEQFREARALAPDNLEARYGVAAMLGHLERFAEAVAAFEQVIVAAPRHAAARRGQIVSLILSERYGEARVKLQEALRIFSRDAALALVQVWLLAAAPDERVRDGALALEIASRVYAERKDSAVREALALAAAESGDFDRAVELQRTLVEEVEGAGESGLSAARRSRLATFERREAWTVRSPHEILSALAAGP